jgi:topoisomerase-4 subunit A
LGENSGSQLKLLTDTAFPRIKVIFGGHDSYREALEVDAEEFIAVKSFKAKGKRLSTFEIQEIEELAPIRLPEEVEELSGDEDEMGEPDTEPIEDELDGLPDSDIIDEITGQKKLDFE